MVGVSKCPLTNVRGTSGPLTNVRGSPAPSLTFGGTLAPSLTFGALLVLKQSAGPYRDRDEKAKLLGSLYNGLQVKSAVTMVGLPNERRFGHEAV